MRARPMCPKLWCIVRQTMVKTRMEMDKTKCLTCQTSICWHYQMIQVGFPNQQLIRVSKPNLFRLLLLRLGHRQWNFTRPRGDEKRGSYWVFSSRFYICLLIHANNSVCADFSYATVRMPPQSSEVRDNIFINLNEFLKSHPLVRHSIN